MNFHYSPEVFELTRILIDNSHSFIFLHELEANKCCLHNKENSP